MNAYFIYDSSYEMQKLSSIIIDKGYPIEDSKQKMLIKI